MKRNNYQKQKIKKWIVRWGGVTVFLVLSHVVILLFQVLQKPEWIGRLIALAIVLCIGTATLFWYSLSPKTEMIKKGALLNRPGYERAKKITDKLFRLMFLSLGIFLLYVSIMFSKDVFPLVHNEQPIQVRGQIMRRSTLWGTWFLRQSISIQAENKISLKKSYSLWYSFAPPPCSWRKL